MNARRKAGRTGRQNGWNLILCMVYKQLKRFRCRLFFWFLEALEDFSGALVRCCSTGFRLLMVVLRVIGATCFVFGEML